MTDYEIRSGYFQWLCDLVEAESQASPYLLLMGDLHRFIFMPLLKRDADRAAEAVNLRDEFLYSEGIPEQYRVYLDGEATVLEILITLARTMDYETSSISFEPSRVCSYFWELIRNLGLLEFSDDRYYEFGGSNSVNPILGNWVMRQYDYDGTGGVFPILAPNGDQRSVEIWYQMQTYLSERYPI